MVYILCMSDCLLFALFANDFKRNFRTLLWIYGVYIYMIIFACDMFEQFLNGLCESQRRFGV